MRLITMKEAMAGMAGMLMLAGVLAGCGPTQAEKDLAARMEAAANKAEAAARAAADAAQRAEASASKAEAIFQKHMTK